MIALKEYTSLVHLQYIDYFYMRGPKFIHYQNKLVRSELESSMYLSNKWRYFLVIGDEMASFRIQGSDNTRSG